MQVRLASEIMAILLLLSLSTCALADKYAGFPDAQDDFQRHIKEVQDYLDATSMPQRAAGDVAYNLPFEFNADPTAEYRGRFMLIHGLNDSPYVWTDVAQELVKRGFDVRAILLPGHGNSPEAQLNMSYKRWLQAARDHLELWQGPDDTPLYLGGFSLGGVLATTLALERTDVSGLLLFSPAYRSSMNHLLRWSGLYSKFKPWVFGGMIIEDNPTKYNSIPINGASQYYKATKFLKSLWKRRVLDMPVLVVASDDDSVVDIDFLQSAFDKRFSSTKKKLLLYSNDTVEASTSAIIRRQSAYPQFRVLNQSHQSVLVAPDNPLFGVGGTVLVCNGNDWPTFSACLYSKESHWFGAQHTASPDNIPVARTTYNPDFAGVFVEFDRVFNTSARL